MKLKGSLLLAYSVAILQPISVFMISGFASNDWYFAANELLRILPWALPTAIFTGINIFLVSYHWQSFKKNKLGFWGAIGGGGSSGLAMVACCAHWIIPLLTVLGVAALSNFLAQYQIWFGIGSLIINLLVFTYLQVFLYKERLVMKKPLMILFLVSLFLNPLFSEQEYFAHNFDKKSSRGPVIFITVEPTLLVPENPWEFVISMGNHRFPLDHDLIESIRIVLDDGQEIAPISLTDSGKGSHHRKSVLTFPGLQNDIQSFKIIIRGIGELEERILEWEV
jgi:hypothetical protein